MSDAAEIAKGLTAAQRAFMLLPLHIYTTGGRTAWLHYTRNSVARAIAKKGLAVRVPIEPGFMASDPTPLGLAVRNHLESTRP